MKSILGADDDANDLGADDAIVMWMTRPDPENLEVKDKFKDTAIQYLYLDHQVQL